MGGKWETGSAERSRQGSAEQGPARNRWERSNAIQSERPVDPRVNPFVLLTLPSLLRSFKDSQRRLVWIAGKPHTMHDKFIPVALKTMLWRFTQANKDLIVCLPKQKKHHSHGHCHILENQ